MKRGDRLVILGAVLLVLAACFIPSMTAGDLWATILFWLFLALGIWAGFGGLYVNGKGAKR